MRGLRVGEGGGTTTRTNLAFFCEQIENFHLRTGSICIASVQKLPIGGECQGGDLTVEFGNRQLVALCVPQAERAVLAAAGQNLAVGAERQRSDLAVMADVLINQLLAGEIEDADRLLQHRERQALPAGMDRQGPGSLERIHFRKAAGYVPQRDRAVAAAGRQVVDAADRDPLAVRMKGERLDRAALQ